MLKQDVHVDKRMREMKRLAAGSVSEMAEDLSISAVRITKQATQLTRDLILRHFRVTIVAVEKQ
jgi:hypothetical protein